MTERISFLLVDAGQASNSIQYSFPLELIDAFCDPLRPVCH